MHAYESSGRDAVLLLHAGRMMIVGGVLVITRKNAVHSALALIVTLLALAGLYLMLYAPFVAGVQIIVYAGGIMVLFLFVIMLVCIERYLKERQFNKHWPVGLRPRRRLADCSSRFTRRLRKGRTLFIEAPMSYLENQNTQEIASMLFDRQYRNVYVRFRNRLAAVAGGDFGGGDYDEEEDLR